MKAIWSVGRCSSFERRRQRTAAVHHASRSSRARTWATAFGLPQSSGAFSFAAVTYQHCCSTWPNHPASTLLRLAFPSACHVEVVGAPTHSPARGRPYTFEKLRPRVGLT